MYLCTVYFTIPNDQHQLTMAEIKASDRLDAGMLEHVADIPEGQLYSWHDLYEWEIAKVIRYIEENIGPYHCDIEREFYATNSGQDGIVTNE